MLPLSNALLSQRAQTLRSISPLSWWLGCAMLVTPPLAGESLPKTKVREGADKAAHELLGEHPFRLQWIEANAQPAAERGKAMIDQQDGVMFLRGEQKDARGNFAKVDGHIIEITPSTFRFRGRVVTRTEAHNGSNPCDREGEFTWAIYGGRSYWRVQQLQNPCGSNVDYIDLFLRPKAKPAAAAQSKESRGRSRR